MTRGATFAAVGDIYLGGLVGDTISKNGSSYPFQYTAEILSRYDITFGNLECPLTLAPCIEKSGPCWHAGPATVDCLMRAGFDILNLSNNHIGDCGNQGIIDTLRTLEGAGLKAFGVGQQIGASPEPHIIEKNGIKIGFLAYCDSYIARSKSLGGTPIHQEQIIRDIGRLRGLVDNVIVSLHHGIEYSDYPTPRTIDLCRAVVDSGADVVLGHHPHVIQGWERYGNGIIVYSLGNFLTDFRDPKVKDQAMQRSFLVREGFLTPDPADTRMEESIIFTCALTPDGVAHPSCIPLAATSDFQPFVPEEAQAKRIRQRLSRLSTGLSDPSLPVYRDLDKLSLKEAMSRAKPSADILKRLHRVRPRHAKLLVRYLRSLFAR
jgi:poly-gamma-glutamate synthesis protein (capsule biosynthesis protein)